MRTRGTLHLLLGPVGAGKTTYAQRAAAASGAVSLDLDAWMVRLFGADPRPAEDVMAWYLERRERCRAVMWDVAVSVLEAGTDVFFEIGLLGEAEREAFYEQARSEDVALVLHVLDAPRDVRRDRVEARNRAPGPSTQIVPPEAFEQASDAWEPLSERERATWRVVDG